MERKKSATATDSMELIPAIDIIDGKCVRLTKGDFTQKKVYNEHPLEVALQFADAGLRRLHLVDLDGAKAGTVRNWKVLETIASKTKLVIDFGGGLQSEKDVRIVLDSGASFATVGTMAVKDPGLFGNWIKTFGAARFFLGADVREEKIAVSGWTEQTELWIYDFIKQYSEQGLNYLFCTDIAKDGALEGPSVELYKNIINKFPSLHLVASGGVTTLDDLYQLKEAGCNGVIMGKALYEGRILLTELQKFL